jgi:hypothetical protein
MIKISNLSRIVGLIVMVGVLAMVGLRVASVQAANAPSARQEPAAAPQTDPALIIQNESQLPDTYPFAPFEVRFHVRGGVPTFHWKLEKGALPPGFKLEDEGWLHGQAEKSGEFQFTLSVKDGSSPQQAVQKEFLLRVRSALTLEWKNVAHVNGSRIEGSVVVSNTTPDDMDLTYVVMAIPSNGRATAIGYQHFALRKGTTGMELPFGENLPHGGYVVHVDVVGEVASRKLIYRERMQTPSALQVTVGP